MNLININTNVTMTMSSLEIAELVQSRHADVRRSIERLAKQCVISLPPTAEVKIQRERREETTSVYQFSGEKGKRDSIIVVAQLSPVFTAKLVDRWQELEAANKPQLPTNYIDALKALVVSEEQKQLALIERDHAIRTKAEIGSRREATAMSTAAVATKRANALEIELDKSKSYASIKRMEMLYHGQKFNWRLLKSACQDLGIEPIDVFDANYGTCKAYPEAAWVEAYALTINNI